MINPKQQYFSKNKHIGGSNILIQGMLHEIHKSQFKSVIHLNFHIIILRFYTKLILFPNIKPQACIPRHMYSFSSYDQFDTYNYSDRSQSSTYQSDNSQEPMYITRQRRTRLAEPGIKKNYKQQQQQQIDPAAIQNVKAKVKNLPCLPIRFDKENLSKLKKVNGELLYPQTKIVESVFDISTESKYSDIFTRILSLDMEYQLATKSISYYEPKIQSMYNIKEKDNNRIVILENNKENIELIGQLDDKIDINIQDKCQINSVITSYKGSIETKQCIGVGQMLLIIKVSYLEDTQKFFSEKAGIVNKLFKDSLIQKTLGEKVILNKCMTPEYYQVSIFNNKNSVTYERLQNGVTNFDNSQPLNKLIKGQFTGDAMKYLAEVNRLIGKPNKSSNVVYNELLQYITQLNNYSESKIAIPNKPQSEIIKYALDNCLTIVQGCFGAGKTYTISCLMKGIQLQQGRGCKILCCTGSNVASDNIAIYANKMNLSVIRVYSKQFESGMSEYTPNKNALITALHYKVLRRLIPRYPDDMTEVDEIIHKAYVKTRQRKEVFQDWYESNNIAGQLHDLQYYARIDYDYYKEKYNETEKEIIEQSNFIICTCSTAGDDRLEGIKANAVIIDESSQCVEPEQILAISHTNNKVIIIGDSKQLPPVLMFQELQSTQYDRSLYERLESMGIKIHILYIQYRLHSGLLEIPNSLFYKNKLTTGIKESDRKLIFKRPGKIAKSLFSDFPTFIVDSQYEEKKSGTSFINQDEARLVIRIVEQLQKEGLQVPLSEISIITMYKSQKYQLQNICIEKKMRDLEINTVDSFQGREKEVIIISCVRCNPARQIGFLNDDKRVNVALTRAKRLLIIVGNVYTLSVKGTWKKIIDYYEESEAIVNEKDII